MQCRGDRTLDLHINEYIAGTRREIVSESCLSTPNLDCNYHFPIDLVPKGNPFGTKSIGK